MTQQIKIGQLWKRNYEPKTIVIIRKVMTHSVYYQTSTEMLGCNKVFLVNNFTLLN